MDVMEENNHNPFEKLYVVIGWQMYLPLCYAGCKCNAKLNYC